MERVLYVEDEDLNWDATEFALGEMFEMHRARTAKEAYSLLARMTFSVVLMDIQLKGSDLNGIQLMQALRGTFKGALPDYARSPIDVPVIFVTAYGTRYHRDELLEVGGEDVLLKPVDFKVLRCAISRIFDRRDQPFSTPAT